MDTAIAWFRAAAKSEGISLEEYARRAGIILPARQRNIDAHEVPMSEMRWQKEAAPVAGSGGAERVKS